jgi:hypothetical protein
MWGCRQRRPRLTRREGHRKVIYGIATLLANGKVNATYPNAADLDQGKRSVTTALTAVTSFV